VKARCGRLTKCVNFFAGSGRKGSVDAGVAVKIVQSRDVEALEKLIVAHQEVSSHLAKRSSDEQSFEVRLQPFLAPLQPADASTQSARELTAITWGQELASVLKTLDGGASADALTRRLKVALRDVWANATLDVFADGAGADDAAQLRAAELGAVQDLRNSFAPILNVILTALDAPPVFMRTKALRALGCIVTTDPTILSMVRRAAFSFVAACARVAESVRCRKMCRWASRHTCRTTRRRCARRRSS
jgi:hypothetical protein